MPENTVSVDRSTVWGNPFVVGGVYSVLTHHYGWKHRKIQNVEEAIMAFRDHLPTILSQFGISLETLRGKNLACWCKEGEACHADVLLEMANGKEE